MHLEPVGAVRDQRLRAKVRATDVLEGRQTNRVHRIRCADPYSSGCGKRSAWPTTHVALELTPARQLWTCSVAGQAGELTATGRDLAVR